MVQNRKFAVFVINQVTTYQIVSLTKTNQKCSHNCKYFDHMAKNCSVKTAELIQIVGTLFVNAIS